MLEENTIQKDDSFSYKHTKSIAEEASDDTKLDEVLTNIPSTNAQENETMKASTAENSTEQFTLPTEQVEQEVEVFPVPEIPLQHEDTANKNTIICREWQTECSNKMDDPVCSVIPEKDAVLWQIKDFASFRTAAKISKLPALVSPQFGGGCYLRLQLYDKKGHINGKVELPTVKAVREGVAHIKISALKPDLKPITVRKLEIKTKPSFGGDKKFSTTSETFRLTKARLFCNAKLDRLICDNSLRIRIDFQYFPFDAPIFRGLERIDMFSQVSLKHPAARHDIAKRNLTLETTPVLASTYELEHALNVQKVALLADICSFCKEDVSQFVEIRNENAVFQACRFLLCARSTKFRDIFKPSGSLTTSRSSTSSAQYGRTSLSQSSLSSITIQNMSVECLDQLLTFIHTDTCCWLEDQTTNIFNVLELFEAADSYGMESFKKRLIHHLSSRLDRDNFVYMFETSERCQDKDFKTLCMNYMDALPGSHVATIMRAVSSQSRSETPRV